MNTSFKDYNPFLQIVCIFGLAFLMLALGTFVSVVIAKFGYGVENLSALGDLNNLTPKAVEALRMSQATTTFFLFLGTAYYTALLYEVPFARFYHLNKIRPSFLIIIGLSIFFFSGPILSALVVFSKSIGLDFGGNNDVLIAQLIQSDTMGVLLLNVLVFGLLPAVGEELIFRGLLQKTLINQIGIPWVGILISAFLFSAFHMEMSYFLARWFMGCLLGLMFYTSRSLWLSILAHFVNNSTLVIVYYLYQKKSGLIEDNPLEETASFDNLELIGSAIIVSAMVYVLYRHRIYIQNTMRKWVYPL